MNQTQIRQSRDTFILMLLLFTIYAFFVTNIFYILALKLTWISSNLFKTRNFPIGAAITKDYNLKYHNKSVKMPVKTNNLLSPYSILLETD